MWPPRDRRVSAGAGRGETAVTTRRVAVGEAHTLAQRELDEETSAACLYAAGKQLVELALEHASPDIVGILLAHAE